MMFLPLFIMYFMGLFLQQNKLQILTNYRNDRVQNPRFQKLGIYYIMNLRKDRSHGKCNKKYCRRAL